MNNKLSELSKPRAFVVTGGTLYQDRAFTDKSTAERSKADRHDRAVVEPLYSQEYVSALLVDRDAWQAAAQALRDELRVSQAIANEYLQLVYHMDAGGDFFEFQRDKNNG
ncbi:hypothetical protein JEM67_16160 [Serratia sp. PAMC26656]|uniref:hypothetical protein n=1 Tax=Serratia sp. PAMC26656 TaxID=2775909 RepID=UPI0018F27B6F|nr:hypothetical protein [Serratia sp. PAMC26656]MBJ7889410.1 hypothetical protein [Serratia sp. PAMC26656]